MVLMYALTGDFGFGPRVDKRNQALDFKKARDIPVIKKASIGIRSSSLAFAVICCIMGEYYKRPV